MSTIDRLTIRRPDDWHLHLRDGAMLEGIVGPSMQHVGRAIIMPNLVPPVVRGDDARAYRDRILKAMEGSDAKSTLSGVPDPLMTLYLTKTTDPDDVATAAAEGLVQIDDERGIKILNGMLDSSVLAHRTTATATAKEVADPRLVKAVRKLLRDPDKALRRCAQEALTAIAERPRTQRRRPPKRKAPEAKPAAAPKPQTGQRSSITNLWRWLQN